MEFWTRERAFILILSCVRHAKSSRARRGAIEVRTVIGLKSPELVRLPVAQSYSSADPNSRSRTGFSWQMAPS